MMKFVEPVGVAWLMQLRGIWPTRAPEQLYGAPRTISQLDLQRLSDHQLRDLGFEPLSVRESWPPRSQR